MDALISKNYQLRDKLHDGATCLVYRAYRLSDNRPVILKILKAPHLDPKRRARFKKEYELIRSLNTASGSLPPVSGIPEALALELGADQWVMVLEDFGGDSLQRLGIAGTLPVAECLHIATEVTEILEQLHQRRVLHKDLAPANLIYNTRTKQVQLIDFGVSIWLSEENAVSIARLVHRLEQALPYMAPEQTGRMNRGVDYRADYYSLGVTLYELLCGRLPFQSKDTLELIHAHIAKQPQPPHELNPRIPPAVSAVVLKLMAKNAEDRYQSAWGLFNDLRLCQERATLPLELQGLGDFKPGTQDFPDRFQIPKKIYGREREVERLVEALERVAQGGVAELLLVSGYSGIGKSTLIYEVYKPVTEHRGYFIAGKADQLQRNVPYLAVAQAFTDLVQQILTEKEEVLSHFRHELSTALGINGKLITELVPELELLIGPQPDVAVLGPSESESRFFSTILSFIRVFCHSEHPLVLFLDDLHWADIGTLRLLESLLLSEMEHLFLIGAYRDNKVDANHPLALCIDRLEKEGVPITLVWLTPLSPEHVNELLTDTLRQTPEAVEPLTDLIMQKTGGNPYFVGEFLKTLYQEGLITLSMQRHWSWNIDLIRAQEITDNVVELLLNNLRKLPIETQDILRFAACIGNRFALQTLAVVSYSSPAVSAIRLRPALDEGFLSATAASDLLAKEPDENEVAVENEDAALVAMHYRFSHDRVQQAAYAMIGDNDRREVHLRIGTLLLGTLRAKQREDRLFEIVDHLNIGSPLFKEPGPRAMLARLNLDAAMRAREGTAYPAARQYAIEGLELVKDAAADSSLLFSLKKELAQIDYLRGDYESSEKLLCQLLEMASTVLPNIDIYSLLIIQYTLTGRYDEAIRAGREALDVLGIELPVQDLEAAAQWEIQFVCAALKREDMASLLRRPAMQSLEMHAALRVLVCLNPAAMYTGRPLYNLIVAKMARLCLEYGHEAEAAFAYASFAVPLAADGEHLQQASELGMMARDLSRKWDRIDLRCKVDTVLGTYIFPWTKPLRQLTAIYDESYRTALQSGDLLFAGNALAMQLLVGFYQGRNLGELISEARRHLSFTQKSQHQIATDRVLACYLPLLNLSGETESRLHFAPNGDEFLSPIADEAEFLQSFAKNRSATALCVYQINKAQLLYLYEEYEHGLTVLQEAEATLTFVQGTLSIVEHCFYKALCAAALYTPQSNHSAARGAELHEIVKNASARLQRWADHCPDNFRHKHLLILAELARISGQHWEALTLYDQAIATAAEHEFPHMEALANERAMHFHLEQRKEAFARIYLQRAQVGHKAWGAARKTEQLAERYGSLLWAGTRAAQLMHANATNDGAEGVLDDALDLATVLKASQAIAGELILSSLLTKLVHLLLENAGAEKGYLLLEQTGEWCVAAAGAVAEQKSLPVEVPISIINFVAHRRQNVVLADAAQDSQFMRDLYVRKQKPRSVLCMPLLKQGQPIAILYLENNLTAGAFTPGRLEMLRMLSAQIAISIENAQLYAQLEDRVRARTQELSAKNSELSEALQRLQETQQQLVHREKLASLGALTAGIAHELRNPLNFINNFAKLSQQLIDELASEMKQLVPSSNELNEYVLPLFSDLKGNLVKIDQHGQRAERIINSMLMHSRDRTSSKGTTDVNQVLTESISLAYHGMRARQSDWNVELKPDLMSGIKPIEAASADLGRVFINLLDNAFYATQRKRQLAGATYTPVVSISSRELGSGVEVLIRDNGTGVQQRNLGKLFLPFFTTKPPGEGVGLGLSICHDIIVQGHKGEMQVRSVEGEFTEFRITLPRA